MSDTVAAAPLRGLPTPFRQIEAALSTVLRVVAVFLICLSTALAFASVVLRYLFGTSYGMVEEVCRFSIVYAVLLYFGPLIMRNAHLAMTVVTDLLPRRLNRTVDIVQTLLLAALLVWLMRSAWTWEAGLYSMGLLTMSGEMQAWVPSAALPVGIALALVFTLLRLIALAVGTPLPHATEAAE
ncbi:hypothetical protein DLJ53_31450 [Acuticoccus sediminis]|uniref:TRAP transporter small permease protein n=1 Tax=Acuticoccus sediminis TaxID=2184697 RepID=A0A8B2NPR1_9HYPH|nr:TRAP transporter small permease subunit [Acuticoccus sediminis]RAH96780.1 hypothetical protein DLJ53_31450 [Acuticoccus sediminis]